MLGLLTLWVEAGKPSLKYGLRVTSQRAELKIPATINTYCPRCRKYTPHKVVLYKKGKDRSLAKGARQHEWELHGYGGQKYPIQRKKSKVTQKQTLKLICTVCGYTIHKEGIRMRKLEIVG